MHKTKDNRLIPIPCMNDSHVLNTIKRAFSSRGIGIKTDKKTQFLLGNTLEGQECTPELFSEITAQVHPYIIEALRRDTTRESCLKFLGGLNPVFESTQQEQMPQIEAIKLVDGGSIQDMFGYEDIPVLGEG